MQFLNFIIDLPNTEVKDEDESVEEETDYIDREGDIEQFTMERKKPATLEDLFRKNIEKYFKRI